MNEMKLLKLEDGGMLSVDLKVFWVLIGNVFFILAGLFFAPCFWIMLGGLIFRIFGVELHAAMDISAPIVSMLWLLYMQNVYKHRHNPGA